MGLPATAVLISVVASVVYSQLSDHFSVPSTVLDLAIRINANSDPSGNYVFSPLGISTALNLLLLGSDGTTKQQLRSFLRYPPEVPDATIHDVYSTMLTTLKSKSPVQIKLANGVVLQKGLGLDNSYIAAARKYETQTGTLDFKNDPEFALNKINEWVANETQNKITKLLKIPPSPATKMVILTAVYFKGAWDNPFPAEHTRKGEFFTSPGNSVQVDYMANVMTVPYAESSALDCKAIVLPYAGQTYGMLFLLPNSNEPGALKQLESKISAEALDHLMKEEMNFKLATVHIPKFKFTQSLSLRPTLQRSGFSSIFGPEANFSKITREQSQVDEILHQAFIEVNEEGTEAAAATAITLSRDAPSKNFIANRPFAFIIRHNKLDLSLFHGRVARPEY